MIKTIDISDFTNGVIDRERIIEVNYEIGSNYIAVTLGQYEYRYGSKIWKEESENVRIEEVALIRTEENMISSTLEKLQRIITVNTKLQTEQSKIQEKEIMETIDTARKLLWSTTTIDIKDDLTFKIYLEDKDTLLGPSEWEEIFTEFWNRYSKHLIEGYKNDDSVFIEIFGKNIATNRVGTSPFILSLKEKLEESGLNKDVLRKTRILEEYNGYIMWSMKENIDDIIGIEVELNSQEKHLWRRLWKTIKL